MDLKHVFEMSSKGYGKTVELQLGENLEVSSKVCDALLLNCDKDKFQKNVTVISKKSFKTAVETILDLS